MKARITVDGRPYDLTIETDEDGARSVVVDGRAYRVDAVTIDAKEPRLLHVTLDGTAHTVLREDLERATIDDVASEFHLDDVRAGPGAGTIGREGAQIHPPMPGKIVSLRVAVGEHVEAGQVLCVLEAMKMQNEVTAPAAGIVTAIRVATGANVDTRDVLLELGPPDATPEPAQEVTA